MSEQTDDKAERAAEERADRQAAEEAEAARVERRHGPALNLRDQAILVDQARARLLEAQEAGEVVAAADALQIAMGGEQHAHEAVRAGRIADGGDA